MEFETSVQLLIKIESLLISIFIFLLDVRSEDTADALENFSTEAGRPLRFRSAGSWVQFGLALPSAGGPWYKGFRFDGLGQ